MEACGAVRTRVRNESFRVAKSVSRSAPAGSPAPKRPRSPHAAPTLLAAPSLLGPGGRHPRRGPGDHADAAPAADARHAADAPHALGPANATSAASAAAARGRRSLHDHDNFGRRGHGLVLRQLPLHALHGSGGDGDEAAPRSEPAHDLRAARNGRAAGELLWPTLGHAGHPHPHPDPRAARCTPPLLLRRCKRARQLPLSR